MKDTGEWLEGYAPRWVTPVKDKQLKAILYK